MPNNLSHSAKELKPGIFSVYPSISDVLYALEIRLIPWFNAIYDDGRKKSLAIVNLYDAAEILNQRSIQEKIQDVESINPCKNATDVFAALAPAIKAWTDERNYIACSRTLASLFNIIANNENPTLSQLSDDMVWHLKEECEKSTNVNTRTALKIAIRNLNGNYIDEKNEAEIIADTEIKSKSISIKELNSQSYKNNYVNYLSEKSPEPSKSKTAIPQGVAVEGKLNLNQPNNFVKEKYIRDRITSRIQKELKGFGEKDELLWKECLLETKNQFDSAEILYRLAREKFLIKSNEVLLIKNISDEEINKNMTFVGCVNQAEAKNIAYRS
jgi:hypothetical protein